MRVRQAAKLLIAAMVFVPAFVAAAPVTVQYPSVECPDTGDEGLQQCIDSVEAGSTVVLAVEIIEESARIEKSLTLRAASRSLQPLLTHLIVAEASGANPVPTIDVIVEDIRFSSQVYVSLNAGSGHSVIIRRIEVGKGAPSPEGVSIQAIVPASVTLEHSFVRNNDGFTDRALRLIARHPNGAVRFHIAGNRITARGNADSYAGIDMYLDGAGSVRADIHNNVISDVATCGCGADAGISIWPRDEIRAEVNIVGNTIVGSGSEGVYVSNDLTTGRLSLDVFNNIFSHNSDEALELESGAPGSLVFRAGFNAHFANGQPPNDLDIQSDGPGNLRTNPRYVDRAGRDFRLRADSPLLDQGLTCSPGAWPIRTPPDATGWRGVQSTWAPMSVTRRGSTAWSAPGPAAPTTSPARRAGTSSAAMEARTCSAEGRDRTISMPAQVPTAPSAAAAPTCYAPATARAAIAPMAGRDGTRQQRTEAIFASPSKLRSGADDCVDCRPFA